MSWTTPTDIRGQVRKLWDRGVILAALAVGEPLFPRRLILKKPTSSEMAERFSEVRDWIGQLNKGAHHYRLVWREFSHRTLGANAVPAEVFIDSVEDALALIGKEKEARRFAALVEQTGERRPRLGAWLAKRPLQALSLADDWPRLLDIVSWLLHHPRPDIYLRQVDIAGVDSKFIESHRGVLAELFDLVVPRQNIDTAARGTAGFCRRYGFRDKPARIRFRLLDPTISLLTTPMSTCPDIAVSGDIFAELKLPLTDVFITENEINFLAFPFTAKSMVVFGAGYGFDILANADWLHSCRIHYWGDIDTHGFAILDQLRTKFPAAVSFLMDRHTLLAHEAHWGTEPQPVNHELPRLTPNEQHLYNDLRFNLLGTKLRLEQERIGFEWVKKALGLVMTS
jgi:hypothetical protein